MLIGNREFDLENRKHTYVMGILNVTPDSFSDGGSYNNIDLALKHTEKMIEEGADIIDVGGESTRPGHVQISDVQEIERVVPVIEAIKKRFDIPLSVDTYKSTVAKASIEVGTDLINDIWGLKYDDNMAKVIADAKAACCIMHNRDINKNPYSDFFRDVISDINESINIALNSGIAKDKIIIDPGVGFAKNYENNLEIMNKLSLFWELKYPVLLGTSRKSVIGNTLNLPVEERLEGTIATTVFAVMNRCSFVRVHDIKENKRAIQMAEAIVNK